MEYNLNFNNTLTRMKCTKCQTNLETYHTNYCPKCDILEVIKARYGSYCVRPILQYGKLYVENFNFDKIFETLNENGVMHYNEIYFEFDIEINDDDTKDLIYTKTMIKKVFDNLNINYNINEFILFYISW